VAGRPRLTKVRPSLFSLGKSSEESRWVAVWLDMLDFVSLFVNLAQVLAVGGSGHAFGKTDSAAGAVLSLQCAGAVI